jgi:hypothetical protein
VSADRAATARATVAENRLPAEPMRVWLAGRGSAREIARETGVGDVTIRRLRRGEYERIGLDVADRLAVGLGSHLDEIYTALTRSSCALCGGPVLRGWDAEGGVLVVERDGETPHGDRCAHGAIPAVVS